MQRAKWRETRDEKEKKTKSDKESDRKRGSQRKKIVDIAMHVKLWVV